MADQWYYSKQGQRVGPVTDCGTNDKNPVDYPDFAVAVARLVASGKARFQKRN